MNRQQQIEHYEEIQQYLQQNNIYGLFGQLVQQLILQKPKDILDFLIQKLESPEKFTLFVVGPPGLSINTIIKKALAYTDKQYELFNCGEEITKIKDQLSEDDKKRFASCLLVEEKAIETVINKIESFLKSDKNYIIEGFPKNLKEAHLLQRRRIHAKNILLINIDDNGLQSILEPKVRQLNQTLSQTERDRVLQIAMMEHKINIRAVKQFYNKYLEIDLSANRQESFIVQQLTKAFTIKNLSAIPRTSSQIIIVGAPFSGRTTLGTKIAEHYNFVYISTSFLIAEEIRRDTIHGRKIKAQYISNQLIDNFLIQKLIEERISKKDCKMQGFVLEGYPKNKEQFENIKSMKLAPTLIVAIDTPSELSKKRSQQDEGKFNSRYEKWKGFAGFLRESKQKIFWVDPKLSVGNLYEEVVHQFQKQFT